MACRLLALLLLLLLPSLTTASVNFPGVEYNAALGGAATASSYYSFSPNALLNTTFVPENAADGLPDATSWWAAGNAGEVFWQVNLSAPVPRAARVVVRWHGFLSPATYRVRVSYNGEVFSTVAVVRDRPLAFDRVDNVTDGLDSAKAFRFLRIVMDAANVCPDEFSCAGSSTTSSAATNERVIYGIRELELWARGNKNGTDMTSDGMVGITAFDGLCGVYRGREGGVGSLWRCLCGGDGVGALELGLVIKLGSMQRKRKVVALYCVSLRPRIKQKAAQWIENKIDLAFYWKHSLRTHYGTHHGRQRDERHHQGEKRAREAVGTEGGPTSKPRGRRLDS